MEVCGKPTLTMKELEQGPNAQDETNTKKLVYVKKGVSLRLYDNGVRSSSGGLLQLVPLGVQKVSCRWVVVTRDC